MSQETRVGMFLIASLAVILTSIVFLGKVRLFQHTALYNLDFQNVEALPPKAAVKVAGVEIGVVSKVELVEGRARVTIKIDPEVFLYQDARVRIGSTGIIGTRYVELEPGHMEPKFKEGSTIVGENGTSLNDMINKISSLFEDDAEHGNAVSNMKATLLHIRHVSEALDNAMGQRSHDLEMIVTNIRDLTESAKVFAQHLEEISTEHKEDVKVALAKFKDVSIKLDNILGKIDRGEGTIGALVSDKKTEQEVKETISSLKETAYSAKKVVGRFTLINTYWNYRYRYNTLDEEGKSDVGITFVPRPGKYYSLGVTNVGEPVENEKHVAYERKNRFTAVLGADYGPFTGFAGAIQSRGGVGLNFRPLWWSNKWGRRVEFSSDASDAKRDRLVNETHLDTPFINAGLHVAINRWLWVGGRVEDIMERAAFTAYTNVVFRDEDFAYLLGFASLAR